MDYLCPRLDEVRLSAPFALLSFSGDSAAFLALLSFSGDSAGFFALLSFSGDSAAFGTAKRTPFFGVVDFGVVVVVVVAAGAASCALS